MRIGILLPTIFRPAGLRRTLQTLDASITLPFLLSNDVSISVAGEREDIEARAIAAEHGASFTHCIEPLQGPGYAYNTALRGAPDCDAYFMASDDMEFTPGWIEEVLAVLGAKLQGSGMVGINDTRKRPELPATHYLMTRDFIVQHNGGLAAYPYPVDYTDVEAYERAKRAGKYAYAEGAIVKHLWIGLRGGDEHFQRNQTKRRAAKELYLWRCAHEFPDDVPAILTEE